MLQNSIVNFNKLVKIRFSDGDQLIVRVFEKSPIQLADEFPLNKEAPLGKAILGHTKGEQIEYQVRNNTYRVTILDIYSNS